MSELRMAALAVAFAAGILTAVHLTTGACALVAGAALVVGLVFLRTLPRSTVLILAAVFLLGAARYGASRQVAPNDVSRYVPSVTAFEGTVVSDPEPVGERVRLMLRIERARTGEKWLPASGNVMVNLYITESENIPHLQYGDTARITARPYLPSQPTNPGRFSWREYLARHGVYACASVRRASQVELLPAKRGNPIVAAALGAKHYLAASIRRIHPQRQASFIIGVVLGTYSYLPPETFKNFSRTGTLHILAASGYNCYVLVLISAPLLRRLRVLPKYRYVVVIGLLVLYLFMVGPKPSLLRASIMASLLLLAVPLRRVPCTRNLFFAAALIVLIIRPSDLFEVGFQLSFLAVWALITVSPVIGSIFARTGLLRTGRDIHRSRLSQAGWNCVGTIGGAAVGTTAITLLTAPLVAYYFNYISLVSIPANMALVLGVPLIFIDGIASAALAPIPFAGDVVGWLGTLVTRGMLGVVNYLGSMKYAAVSTGSPAVLAILGYYLILYAILNYVRSTFAEKQAKRVDRSAGPHNGSNMDCGRPAR